MSVLTCPVCQGSMKEVSRSGVVIDTCTRCRGVWLDRGELEKLAAVVVDQDQRGFLGSAPIATPAPAHAPHYRKYDDDDDDDRRRYGRKSRMRSFLDIFD